VVASVLCYATGNIIFRSKLHGIQPHIALLSRSITAITTFFLVSPFLEHPFIFEVQSFPLTMIPVLIGFAFVSRFLNTVTYYVAIDRLQVSTVSLVQSMDVIFSIFFAFLYLGEPIAWYHYAGGLFIILGNLLLELLGTHPTEEHLEDHLKQRAR
jgi:drug/metabolite transporter (DMT)-like permease